MLIDEYIFKNRKTLNCTLLAEKLGCHRCYLSSIISGKSMPSIKFCKKVQEVTNGECKWREIFDHSLDEKEKRSA